MSGNQEKAIPAVDPARLESLRELQDEEEPDFLADLIRSYLDEAPMRITSIDQAIASGDMARVAEACHLLKGSSKNLGANRFANLLMDLEIKAGSDQGSAMSAAWGKALHEFDKVKSELNAVLEKGGRSPAG